MGSGAGPLAWGAHCTPGGAVALHQEDLKQLLAASTVSQYGYMFAGLGALGGAAAASHLVAHAAFKALLFLLAGVLLHQGMRRLDEMGGLRRPMPLQAGLFLLGALSLAALPPTSGFFTKEALLVRVEQASMPAFLVLLVVTLLTAAYATRALVGAFGGGRRIPPRAGIRPHEPRMAMTLPEILLALAVLGLAALMLPPLEHRWAAALGQGELPGFHMAPAAVAVALALTGVAAVWVLHRRRTLVPLRPVLGAAGSHWALQWFGGVRMLDRAGESVLAAACALDRVDRTEPATSVALGVLGTARRLGTFDTDAVDAATARASAVAARALAGLSLLSDRRIVDGAIGQLDGGLMLAAFGLSRVQTGLLYQYYSFAAGGALLLIVYTFIVLGI